MNFALFSLQAFFFRGTFSCTGLQKPASQSQPLPSLRLWEGLGSQLHILLGLLVELPWLLLPSVISRTQLDPEPLSLTNSIHQARGPARQDSRNEPKREKLMPYLHIHAPQGLCCLDVALSSCLLGLRYFKLAKNPSSYLFLFMKYL